MYIYIYMYICISLSLYIYIYILGIGICMCICVYVCIYTHNTNIRINVLITSMISIMSIRLGVRSLPRLAREATKARNDHACRYAQSRQNANGLADKMPDYSNGAIVLSFMEPCMCQTPTGGRRRGKQTTYQTSTSKTIILINRVGIFG